MQNVLLTRFFVPLHPKPQTQASDRVRIITLPQVANDLADMGLVSGIAVQIVSRTASGSAIVSFQGRNLGIGAAIAQTIGVELI